MCLRSHTSEAEKGKEPRSPDLWSTALSTGSSFLSCSCIEISTLCVTPWPGAPLYRHCESIASGSRRWVPCAPKPTESGWSLVTVSSSEIPGHTHRLKSLVWCPSLGHDGIQSPYAPKPVSQTSQPPELLTRAPPEFYLDVNPLASHLTPFRDNGAGKQGI